MDNLSELIGLYGLDSLPMELQKQRELKRWRDIMSQQKYEQPFLDGFLKADAEAREAMIDETTRQIHLARQFIRFDKAQKICKNERTRTMLDRLKRETLQLMRN